MLHKVEDQKMTIPKTKTLFLETEFTVKQSDGEDEPLIIQGIANASTKDRVGDVILPEAWTKGGLANYLKNPVVLAFHKYDTPIGSVVENDVTSQGLHVVAEISKAAGNVYTLIKEGILKAFSVGFRVKDADYDSATDIFVIKDLELFEISVVSVPANADSVFSIKKSFKDDNEFDQFKSLFTIIPEKIEAKAETIRTTGEKRVSKEITLTPEELEKIEAKAAEKALKDAETDRLAEIERKKEMEKVAIEVGTSGTEKLLAEVEERFKVTNDELTKSIEDLRGDLTEKAAELTALQNNRMEFHDKGGERKSTVTDAEIDTAVLASKILGIGIEKTKYFEGLVEKAGAHLAGTTGSPQGTADDWETLFSTRLYEDIKDKTIIEPLFSNVVQMQSRTMVFPWNPDASYATWVADSAYGTSDGSSSGVAATHLIQDNYLKAEKLAAKEYLAYEEEEDAIIAIAPLIRDAVMRRMVKSTDQELLRGAVGTTINSGVGLLNGVVTIASAFGTDYQFTQSGAFGSSNPVTISDLQQTRRKMGVYGLMPGDVVYVISQDVQYDLLEDPDFRTVDLVGDRATILRGQIGSVNGSPVVVSDAFATHAAGAIAGIALNRSNYLRGELRGILVERDREVVNQRNVLIATRRFAFTEIVPTVAAATTDRSPCGLLKLAP